MTYNFTEGQLDPPTDLGVVEGLSSRLGVALPSDYLDFLKHHNGGDGFVGKKYIIFWKAEELADFNREYEVEKYAPGILLFGSSGGGEGYGFDAQSAEMPIVRVPFIGMARNYAVPVAKDFPDLFAKLAATL
jgi:SMI1 / KNR4 family (SUKH-1)